MNNPSEPSPAEEYLFPPHAAKPRYTLWDPVDAGPRIATLDHADRFRGVKVHVLNTLADGIGWWKNER